MLFRKMKKPIFLPLAAAAAISAACTGVDSSKPHQVPRIENLDGPYKRVLVTNYGYYLFNWIPLASGGGSDGSFSVFSDRVNVAEAMKTLNAECAKAGATEISGVQADETSTCFFKWSPIFSSTFGIYWYREIQISATINTAEPGRDAE